MTAVLVVHDGATWLTQCLDALALQTRPPDHLVVVDTGSVDSSRRIVAAHGWIRKVVSDVLTISAPRESTFGEAVGRAAERVSSGPAWSLEPTFSQVSSSAQWLWLLHDDSAADPDALAHLLGAARRSPSVGVAGPKLMTWEDPSRLLEVGQQITLSGRRAGGPAVGEPDQGQHDQRNDVLGVNTSGMLIRRDVFDELGGFDPAFGQFRDDLDLCWRAQLAGHRVIVAPRARVREAAASTNGQRSPHLSPEEARRRDRRHGRQVALARCSPQAVPILALWILMASLGSAAALLLVKRPRSAWAELCDLGSLITPWRPLVARWRSRGIPQVRRRDLHGLFASPGDGLRHVLDAIHAATNMAPPAGARLVDGGSDSTHSLESGPVSDDAEPFHAASRGIASRILQHPGFLAVMIGVLLAAAAWRSLLGALVTPNVLGLTGAELLPVSSDASGIWHSWLDGWHGAGLGNALESAPYLPVLAAGAWIVEHLPLIQTPTSSVGVLIAWLLVGAIPLSAWTAYLGARVITRSPWPRAWAALAWASLATLTAAQASGRLGPVVAHIMLPLVAAGFVCAARPSVSNSATFGAAAALGVMGAFSPLLAVLGAFTALVLLIVGQGRTRLRAAVLLIVPVGLLGPWILRPVDNPLLLLAGPGMTVWHGADSAPWQLALLHPGGPGSYPALLSAPVVLAGVLAMSRRTSRPMTLIASLTVTGLALGLTSPQVIIGRIPPELAGAGGPITAWAGTGLDLAALALIAAALLGSAGLPMLFPRLGMPWHQILGALVTVAAILGVAGSIVMAGWFGAGGALAGTAPTTPAVAADQAYGPTANRLLVITSFATSDAMTFDPHTIGYRLVGREVGPIVRDLPDVPAAAPDRMLATAVGNIVNQTGVGTANAARDALNDQGVGFVAFRGASTDVLVRQLDATSGLTRLSNSRGLILWRVLPGENAVSSSRLRLVDAKGAPLQNIAVTGDHGQSDVSIGPTTRGGLGRRLVVAEPKGWADHARVTFAGRELSAAPSGEQPTYLLPPIAGQLSIALVPTHQWWRWGQLGLLLVVLFLAAPLGPTRSRRT